MADELTTKGKAFIDELKSEAAPQWVKNLSFAITALVGFVLALGLNIGDVVNNYMTNRQAIETTALSQNGQLEVNALTGLIEANKGMSTHITDLIVSINKLITENNELSAKNADLTQENATLSLKKSELENQIRQLQQENQDLKTRLELKQ